MKLVIDTNIFYSAIGFDNTIYDFLFSVLTNPNCRIYCSDEIIQELKVKLFSTKFDQKTKNILNSNQKNEFLDLLMDNLIFMKTNLKVDVCRDPDGNKFLELSAEVDADYIITGDQDLLVLQSFQNTKILKPSQFMALNLL